MVTREYECADHGYFESRQNISEPSVAFCPECGVQGERVFLNTGTFCFKGANGGIPDYHKSPSEYEGWQREQFRKLKEDIHPANRGKTKLTNDTWAPKERIAAVAEKKAAN